MTEEERKEVIALLEGTGHLDPECAFCKEHFYTHPTLQPFAPGHKPKPRCESGGHPHCTCDTCF